MDTIEILKYLVEFNTVEDNENQEIINWIEEYLKKIGFECKKITDNTTQKSCLIAEIGENPIMAFCGHLDTVKASDAWTKDPFKLNINGNKIYGLGVCDMKGGISAFLKACSSINKNKLKRGIKLFFTYDEEIGFNGIKLLLQNNIEFPKYLILAEPTDLEPIIATKGCMEMKVDFYGKSSHSSNPNNGKNAILAATKFIDKLMIFSKELQEYKNDTFSIPYTTINMGKIYGGDVVNKVPDKCTIEFDARTVEKSHNKIIIDKVKDLLKDYDANLDIGINIQANTNRDNSMIKEIEKITKCNAKSENYITEASFIKNAEFIILGVGPMNAHQSDEYIEKEKLDRLVEIYNNIIKKYCY